MTNELRKTLGRNMRFARINNDIDNQIKQLQARTAYDVNAQTQINALEQQKTSNEQQMRQPMTEQEYAEYDDNGQYIGNTVQQTSATQQNTDGIGQTLTDGVNHAAQGVGLGWSDELNGAIGGIGRVAANGVMQAMGQNVNGETLGDAWNNGYQEYRDYARQELDDGYKRNPGISAVSEVVGSAISPVKIHKAPGYNGSLGNWISSAEDIAKSRWINSVGNGVINGAGYTDENNHEDYIKNIGKNVGANVLGTAGGNKLFGSGNEMYQIGRGVMNSAADAVPYTYDYFRRKHNDE